MSRYTGSTYKQARRTGFSILENGMYILKGSTDKYKFYCSPISSYLNETNKICPVRCQRFGHILIQSTESSYIKYINFVGGKCYS